MTHSVRKQHTFGLFESTTSMQAKILLHDSNLPKDAKGYVSR